MFVPLAPAAQNLGVGLRRPCRGQVFGGMLGAMARITPPQPNETMAPIAHRFLVQQANGPLLVGFLFLWARFEINLVGSNRFKKGLGSIGLPWRAFRFFFAKKALFGQREVQRKMVMFWRDQAYALQLKKLSRKSENFAKQLQKFREN
jgi:hypothetical protein